MNERIKQLTVQARNYAFDQKHHYERVHNTEQCMEDYREVYNTKFAELIVRECIQVGGPEDSYTDDWFMAKAHSVAKIKQHFGVEE